MVFVCFALFRPSDWTFFICDIPFCLRYAFLFAIFYFLYEMIFFFALSLLICWCLAFILPFLFYFSLSFLICWCFGLFFAFSVFVLALLGNRRKWSLNNQIVTICHWYHYLQTERCSDPRIGAYQVRSLPLPFYRELNEERGLFRINLSQKITITALFNAK